MTSRCYRKTYGRFEIFWPTQPVQTCLANDAFAISKIPKKEIRALSGLVKRSHRDIVVMIVTTIVIVIIVFSGICILIDITDIIFSLVGKRAVGEID
jgi:hypothetical protein